jgi:hypothetical protein
MFDFLYSFNGCVFATALIYLSIWLLKAWYELRFIKFNKLQIISITMLIAGLVCFVYLLSVQMPAIIATFMFVNLLIGSLEAEGGGK